MKSTSVLVLLLGGCCVSAAGGNETENQRIWSLAQDVLVTSNQISFSQGSNGVWYFLESRSLSHDPLTYSFLPTYTVFCEAHFDPSTASGLACLGDRELDVVGNRLPAVGVNFSNITLFPLSFGFPPRSVFMHPGIDKLTIVGWQSPINGRIRITGSFGDLDPTCGDGILWSIDKGRNTLRSGDLPNGGADDFAVISTVKKDQIVYFIVHPKAEYSCDTTSLRLTITR